jgi:hypothetical protein
MILFSVVVLVIAVTLFFTLTIRTKDLPPPDPVSPTQYLDDRKAQIYENLRDLQFEYRVGKLSDEDYQQSKQDLQKELANVLAEIDRLKQTLASHTTAPASAPAPTGKKSPQRYVCPSCKAEFQTALKFCGECGKPMRAAQA